MILKHPGIYFLYTTNHMSSYLSSLVSSIKDFFGYTIINHSDQSNKLDPQEIKKIICCILSLNNFILSNFDGICMKSIIMYIISVMPYNNIEVDATNHCGVVISSESLFRTSTYIFDKMCELSYTVHDDLNLNLNLNKFVFSNIRSLLLDEDYLMMLLTDGKLIMKRQNCEQKVILDGVKSIAHSKFFMFAVLTNGSELCMWDKCKCLFKKSGCKIGLQNVRMIKCGTMHMCAITNNFELHMWDSCNPLQKHPLSDIVGIVDVDCCGSRTCVLSKKGEIYTWDFNNLNDTEILLEKLNFTDVVSVGIGKNYLMCLTKFGIIYLWKYHNYHNAPYEISLCNIVNISCGDDYFMAVTTENKVYMIGKNCTIFNPEKGILPYQFSHCFK